jgi:hypothetical protein
LFTPLTGWMQASVDLAVSTMNGEITLRQTK